MRILVAEDDRLLADVVAEALTEERYDVTCVATLEEARRLTRNQAWDVVILDGFGTSYLDAGAEERALLTSFSERAPVILTTGRSWGQDIDPADFGLAAILLKPYDLGDLLDTIQSVQRANETA